MERISVDVADVRGMDFSMYVYKPRRGVKRGAEDNKETYKLPHRLIEKKRRDRINECIAQLKDLLPEHLKLTTLGHLEKAVVLELTLKHVKALSGVLEQQQQKIMALQNDLQIGDRGGGVEAGEEMFRSGFHLCAKEVLHYLSSQDSSRDLTPSHVISHIQKVAADALHHQSGAVEAVPQATENLKKQPAGEPKRAYEGSAKNCVPVIQRTYPHAAAGEQSGSDTDTDSGYGGEHEKRDAKAQWSQSHAKEGERRRVAAAGAIKQEADEPRAKKSKSDPSEDETLSGRVGGGYMSFSPNQPPFCLPFYLLPPATYPPMLHKRWYHGGMPAMYPGVSRTPDTSPRAGSPASSYQHPMDAPALPKAPQQVAPLNLEAKD
uniref:Basic helix-loop-helix family, member e40 n=2 Tax=Gasterosteus aculeatus TaxID=69293 RepID=A0AAQ4RNC4_GASAC|nr:class E basic helix-loop-helix protein 40 [Gasterosteus aculeatus aculeatus]